MQAATPALAAGMEIGMGVGVAAETGRPAALAVGGRMGVWTLRRELAAVSLRSLTLPGPGLEARLRFAPATSPACAGAEVEAYRQVGAVSSRYSGGLVGPFLLTPLILFYALLWALLLYRGVECVPFRLCEEFFRLRVVKLYVEDQVVVCAVRQV